MPKRKGLGREIAQSLDILDDLLGSLSKFASAPLKKGLQINKAYDEHMAKKVNDLYSKARELSLEIEDLRDVIKGIRTDNNSRFSPKAVTASRVIRRYLMDSIEE